MGQTSAGLPKGHSLETYTRVPDTFAWVSTETFKNTHAAVCLTHLEEKNQLKTYFLNAFPHPPLAIFFLPTGAYAGSQGDLSSPQSQANGIWGKKEIQVGVK